jgi:hypothetical protein
MLRLARKLAIVRPPTSRYASHLEEEYAAVLDVRKAAMDIQDWRYAPLRLVLADRTTYEPDFFVIASDYSVELHEVKGFWRDDARVKIKVAARNFPWFKFIAVQHKNKRSGWTYEEFGI